MRVIVLSAALMIFAGCLVSNSPSQFTVKITNLQGNSGGSGSIVFSSPESSLVLTNGHVCEVAKFGGLVHTDTASHLVTSYRVSNVHDLCLISVASSLGTSATHLSPNPPRPFDGAAVSGHPKLLPTIITVGHFSQKQLVSVMIGSRSCSQDELEAPETGLFCMLVGKLPIIKTYEAIVVSPLIQPGSSGSAVYTEDGEIGAVIFAGSGEIGYGLAVPHEYVANFLSSEIKTLDTQYPSLILRMSSSENSKKDLFAKMKEVCDEHKNKIVKLCALVTETLKYSDMIQ